MLQAAIQSTDRAEIAALALADGHELLRRRGARKSLIRFTELCMPDYRAAVHHYRIAEALERVERSEIDRLMIVMPPRHGKSTLASRYWPAWCLGRNPARQVIAASYNSELASDFGRDVRNIVASPECARVFPDLALAADSTAADRWHTADGGSYVAAGVGTAVTGRGADIALIDDPVKDRAEADSELSRGRTWAWYQSVLYTRLQPGGAIVLILTRWNEDDLAGRLLEAQKAGGDQWETIELPAIAEDGRALWPERYPLEALERIRAAIGPRDFSALYQGRPAPEKGGYFEAAWLRVMPPPPVEKLMVYGASDYAVTAAGGDWTVHLLVGVDAGTNMFLLDVWRARTDTSEWVEAWCDLVRKWKPVEWAEEGGQIKAAVGPFLERRQIERAAYCPRRQFPTKHDKSVRAQSIRGRMALRGLNLPPYAPWLSDFRHELLMFPAGKNDDQVDALGLIGQMLDRIQGAPLENKPLKYSSKGIV